MHNTKINQTEYLAELSLSSLATTGICQCGRKANAKIQLRVVNLIAEDWGPVELGSEEFDTIEAEIRDELGHDDEICAKCMERERYTITNQV